jgi:hypothetical protein
MSKSPKTKASKAKVSFKPKSKPQKKAKPMTLPPVAPEEQEPIITVPAVEETQAPKVNKKKLMLEMLKRPEGASIAELEKATGWQPHSVRGSLVNLKNKDKHPITSTKEDGTRRYFLKEEAATGEAAE